MSNNGAATPEQPRNNMPPAVRAQVAAANALIEQIKADPGKVPAGTETQTMPDGVTPGTNEVSNRAQWSPPPVTVTPAQPQAPQEDQEDFKQKYQTLQGKYNAETKSMREILAAQQQTMDKLIESRPSTVMPPATPAPTQSPEDYLKSLGVSEKEIEDYGELLPIIVKMAQNMLRPTAAKLEAELAKTQQAAGTVANAQMKTARDALFSYMDNRVPNWRIINEHESFLAWLDQTDLFSGTTRRQSLTSAFQNLDSARVAGIFERFVQEDSANRSASGPQVDPQTLIAPGVPRGGAGEAPGSAQGRRVLTESEIKDFYTRVRRKQVSPEQYAQFSAEIANAVAEGRVRPDRTDHHINR
jgi:hypothetical protein